MRWTNEIVSNNNGELFVEFTNSEKIFADLPSFISKRFTKKYISPETNVEAFVAEKLANIETLCATHMDIQSAKNVVQEITTGWSFKLITIDMPYDYIEVVAEMESPYQVFYKMFQITEPRLTEYVYTWIEAEKNKIADLIANEDDAALSDYFGQEVDSWQQ